MKTRPTKKHLRAHAQVRLGVTCQQCRNDFNQESQHCSDMPGTYGATDRDKCEAENSKLYSACLENCTGPIEFF